MGYKASLGRFLGALVPFSFRAGLLGNFQVKETGAPVSQKQVRLNY